MSVGTSSWSAEKDSLLPSRGSLNVKANRIASIWLKDSTAQEQSKAAATPPENSLEPLLSALYRFSPIVEAEIVPDAFRGRDAARFFRGANLDLSGCEKLFDGEVNLLREMSTALAAFCPEHQIAIAPSLGAAWAFSRFGKKRLCIVSKQHLRKAVGNLPLAALRLEPKILSSLEDLNLSLVEHVLSIPRRSLLSRFGPELLKRIDQILGVVEEPLRAAEFATEMKAEKIFTGPVLQLEAIEVTAKKLLGKLLERLAMDTQKPAHLVLEVQTVQCPPRRKEILLSIPSAEEHHLWSLLRTQIERLDMGLGVERIALRVSKTQRITAVEESPLVEQKENESTKELGSLLDIWAEKLGPESVCRTKLHESYLPERSFSFAPFLGVKERKEKDVGVQPNTTDVRPSLLFHIPTFVEVIAALPDSPPSLIKWRGNHYRVVNGIGPERIAPEWWGEDRELMKTRDYFKIQLQSGAWLWVFREAETQRWFIHGVWC